MAMITAFACKDTQALFNGRRVARFANIAAAAMRKLQQVNAATTLKVKGARLELFFRESVLYVHCAMQHTHNAKPCRTFLKENHIVFVCARADVIA